MNVLVTDGENRSALAVTRSLGRKGCRVFVTGATKGNISAASRFCLRSFTTPDPLLEGKTFTEEILEIAVKEKIDIIFPMTEQSIFWLNKVRDLLPANLILACALPVPMETVSNKYNLCQLAQRVGVPIPKTIFVDGCDDFRVKEPKITSFPLVVKPSFSKIFDGDRMISASVMYAADRAQLNSLFETKPVLRYPSLIQEMIPGEGTGLFTLFDVDRHLVLFAHRRLLEKPPTGGVSVISQAIPLDPDLIECAEKLLTAVGWKGVAMVEFKRDVRDGRAKLMEINGRFWGSLQLAVSAGVDFPSLSLDYYFGKKPASLLTNYRVGLKLKWFFGILDHLIIRMKKNNDSRVLFRDLPTFWQVARELFTSGSENTSFDVFKFEDPRSFIAELKGYVRNFKRFVI